MTTLSATDLLNRFKAQDAALDARRSRADDLRKARVALMDGWSEVVSRGDLPEIARRSIVKAEIDHELARLGC
jgi:hypothetical protein